MTLIISYLTGRYIVQASDRRVTYGDGRVGEVMNKAVVIGHSGCAAYTGLAFLDGRHPTDEFLMQCVFDSASNNQVVFDVMSRSASRAVRMNPGLPKEAVHRGEVSRTSFVICSFMPRAREPQLNKASDRVPVLTVISNAQFDLSESWATSADKHFRMTQGAISPGKSFLHAAGQPIPALVRKRLVRDLARADRRSGEPEVAARLIARAIQEVHTANSAVGPSVNCVLVRNITTPTRTYRWGKSDSHSCHDRAIRRTRNARGQLLPNAARRHQARTCDLHLPPPS